MEAVVEVVVVTGVKVVVVMDTETYSGGGGYSRKGNSDIYGRNIRRNGGEIQMWMLWWR